MPRSIGIAANGDVVATADDGTERRLLASAWMNQSTNARAQNAVNNWLAANGFPGWGGRVTSRAAATGLMITAEPTLTNWWMGGRL